MHPVLGEVDDEGPVGARNDLPEPIEETVVEVPRVPEPPRATRILRNLVAAALRRVAAKLETGYKRDE